MTEKANYTELAKALIPLIGEKDNIEELSHCVTRLRFILRDDSLVRTDEIRNLPGVLQAFSSGGQYQVVIGTAVGEAYDAIMKELKTESASEEISTAAETRKNRTALALGKVTGFLTGCMQPLIPMMISVGMLRTIAMIFGPGMLGLIGEGNGTLQILTMIANAGYASFPVFIAWSASNYLKTNTVLALLYGAFLIYPDLSALLNSTEALTLFGIPVMKASYTSQVVPVMLIMIAMYYVERLLKKYIPENMQFIGIPMLETLIMLPVMLCAVGPLGTVISNGISEGAISLYKVAGPLSVALIGGFFVLICAAGVHAAMIATAFAMINTQGYDSVAMVGAGAAAYACFGIYLSYTLFVKNRKSKAVGTAALLTHAVGGIAEPGMFSLLFTHGYLLVIQIISAFFGALYLGIQKVNMYTPGISNFLAVFQFAGGDSANFRNAVIGCAISFILGLSLTAFAQMRMNKNQIH